MRAPRGLWLRNSVGAAVVGAALTLLAVTTLWPTWRIYQVTVRPEHVVPPQELGVAAGQTWSVDGTRHLAGSPAPAAAELPPGAVLDVVTVQRTGTPEANFACMGVLTDGEHRWRGEPLSTYAIPAAAGAGFNCTAPGPVQWAFLIPGGTVATALDITTMNGAIVVRLEL